MSQPQEPRTQSIPVVTPDVVTPDAPAEPQPAAQPRPAFLSQSEPAPQAQPATPPTTAVLPAVGPNQAPQQVTGPATVPPQAPPPEQPWPQPGPAAADPAPADPPHSTGPLDIVPGFSSPATPPVPPSAGSTAVPVASSPVHDEADDGAGTAGPGTRARAAGKAFGARLGGGLRSGHHAGRGLDRTVLSGLGLGLAGLALLEFGLTLDPGNRSLWSAVPSWSAFATVAAVAALVPLVLALLPQRLPERTAWRVGAAGAAGVAAFWVLIVLPLVASDRGFLLTAAAALTAGAVWLAPGRRE
jgi:hypothetical protein